jgi:hypothetical protein
VRHPTGTVRHSAASVRHSAGTVRHPTASVRLPAGSVRPSAASVGHSAAKVRLPPLCLRNLLTLLFWRSPVSAVSLLGADAIPHLLNTDGLTDIVGDPSILDVGAVGNLIDELESFARRRVLPTEDAAPGTAAESRRRRFRVADVRPGATCRALGSRRAHGMSHRTRSITKAVAVATAVQSARPARAKSWTRSSS